MASGKRTRDDDDTYVDDGQDETEVPLPQPKRARVNARRGARRGGNRSNRNANDAGRGGRNAGKKTNEVWGEENYGEAPTARSGVQGTKSQRAGVKRQDCHRCASIPDGPDKRPCIRIDGPTPRECATCSKARTAGDPDPSCRSRRSEMPHWPRYSELEEDDQYPRWDVEDVHAYADHGGDDVPETHLSCIACRQRGRIDCDVDMVLGIGCTFCRDQPPQKLPNGKKGQDFICRYQIEDGAQERVMIRRRKDHQQTSNGNEGDATQSWYRHRCDTCRTRKDRGEKRLRCSWLDNRTTWDRACNECARDGYACFDEERLVGEIPEAIGTDVAMPASWKLTRETHAKSDEQSAKTMRFHELRPHTAWRKQCLLCQDTGGHCRVSRETPNAACHRCTQFGLVCVTPDGATYDLWSLRNVGFGKMLPFVKCKSCEENESPCDAQRPCDSCVAENRECDEWGLDPSNPNSRSSVHTKNCFQRRPQIRTGILYYLALGYGAEGVDDDKIGDQLEHWIGPAAPFWARPRQPEELSHATYTTVSYNVDRTRGELLRIEPSSAALPHRGANGTLGTHGMTNELTVEQLREMLLEANSDLEAPTNTATHSAIWATIQNRLPTIHLRAANNNNGDGGDDGDGDDIASTGNVDADMMDVDNVDSNNVDNDNVDINNVNNIIDNADSNNVNGGNVDSNDVNNDAGQISIPIRESGHRLFASWEYRADYAPLPRTIDWQDDTDDANNQASTQLVCQEPRMTQGFLCGQFDSDIKQCSAKTHDGSHAVCGDCSKCSSSEILRGLFAETKSIVGMRLYLCAECSDWAAGNSRTKVTQLTKIGVRKIWGQAQEAGGLPTSGLKPVTGCACGEDLFGRTACRRDRIEFASGVLARVEAMRNWIPEAEKENIHSKNLKARKNGALPCPVCPVRRRVAKDHAQIIKEAPDGMVAEQRTKAWACLACSDLVINEDTDNLIVPGWDVWFHEGLGPKGW